MQQVKSFHHAINLKNKLLNCKLRQFKGYNSFWSRFLSSWFQKHKCPQTNPLLLFILNNLKVNSSIHHSSNQLWLMCTVSTAREKAWQDGNVVSHLTCSLVLVTRIYWILISLAGSPLHLQHTLFAFQLLVNIQSRVTISLLLFY